MKTITLERQRVGVSATIRDDAIRDSGGPMANACVEASAIRDMVRKELVLRMEATLYGREAVRESVTHRVTCNVFDPEHIPMIPATWWDHLLHDLAWWLARHSPKAASGGLVRFLLGHVRTVQAPQSYSQEVIPTEHVRSLTLACPHLGKDPELCQQFVMLAVDGPEPCFAVPPDGDNPLGLSTDANRWVREHMFRHHLAALAARSGLDDTARLLWQIDELFRRYGVGP